MATDIDILVQKFESHCIINERENKALNSLVKGLKSEIVNMKENHLSHLDQKVTRIEGDVKWIKAIGSVIVLETLAVLIKLIFV